MSIISTATAMQATFDADVANEWSVELSTNWDILGPFPIQAREQQFLSPSFPLNLSEPIDYHKTWPSSYADGGRVSWATASAEDNGTLQVSFPNIRWESLRATEGWAVLQHHAVLHTTLTVYPPKQVRSEPHLRVQLIQGSYFTVLPTTEDADSFPRWYAGNIYEMERGLPRIVPFPKAPSKDSPTIYDVFVSGDYEIRLFGDPHSQGRDIPVQSLSLTFDIEDEELLFAREPTQDVLCDFVDGFAFGDAIGVGMRSITGSWAVTKVSSLSTDIALELIRTTRIADGQTRIIPIRVTQSRQFRHKSLDMELQLTSGSDSQEVFVSLPVSHHEMWDKDVFSPILATYFFAKSMPSAFIAIPPERQSHDAPKPPILALHGAGVDIVTATFWADSLPRNPHSWFVLPSGRTSWGLDWHGPSAQDAWSSVDALSSILEHNSVFDPWKFPMNSPVILLGHSNGGQGAWYSAARYPDRVVAVVPASAYIKSQSYVPLTMSRSARFTDPALLSVLESSLTPDNNDLFMSNLVDTPILAIHGGDDENVPVWHSREAVSILETWNPVANVTLREDPGESHWYSTVFKNDQVTSFLENAISAYPNRHTLAERFTLTVSVPSEVGSLHGWSIQALTIPGRLGRLSVQRANEEDDRVRVKTSNLESLSVDTNTFPISRLLLDDTPIHLKDDEDGIIYFEAVNNKVWKVVDQSKQNIIQASGRIQSVLSSNGPITLVIPDDGHTHEMNVALRIAHDLELYHRLDSEIIRSSEAFKNDLLGQGNVVVIGNDAAFSARMNCVPQRPLEGPGIGLIYLHSHPLNSNGNMVMLESTDGAGLERVARLFPIRTGIPVPDWLVIGPLADSRGTGGVISAGVWGNDWSWNSEMSWFS
ncbi:hypothetical protein BDZ89DRAFT_1061691 [Hymenopellis radicata]|nr:hypothetical protein BDZ89DRAFT_1061691 [Hymenopellis radicata]